MWESIESLLLRLDFGQTPSRLTRRRNDDGEDQES